MTCIKCNTISFPMHEVQHPKYGKVELCDFCNKKWAKIVEKANPIRSPNFIASWCALWEKFMNDEPWCIS